MTAKDGYQCPECLKYIRDPRYRGPDGHYITVYDWMGEPVTYGGDDLCFDCWCINWELQNWHFADKYLKLAYLLWRGWNKAESARALRVSRRTIYRWRKKIAQNTILMSQIEGLIPHTYMEGQSV